MADTQKLAICGGDRAVPEEMTRSWCPIESPEDLEGHSQTL